jgi:NAD(P)H-nitrite reductase large subunit
VTTEMPFVCRCEEIKRSEVVHVIEEGASTVDEVKKRTRAGMGLCQGRSCGKLVAGIIVEATGQDLSVVLPMKKRPPVRPIPMSVLANAED